MSRSLDARLSLLAASTAAAGLLILLLRRRPRIAATPESPRLEVCVDSVESALAAEAGGASRVELCDALVEGGLTPSAGKLRVCVRRVALPVHAMLRPRSGDFLYSELEIDVILADLAALKAAGAAGFVFGALLADGTVDEPLLKRVVAAAWPRPVTFHRALDVAADPLAALAACARCGVARVLSSGGCATALEGAATLRRLVDAAAKLGGPTIAAGGGVTEENVAALLRASGVDEVHGSCREPVRSAMRHRPPQPVPMGGERRNTADSEFEWKQASERRVRAAVDAARDVARRADEIDVLGALRKAGA